MEELELELADSLFRQPANKPTISLATKSSRGSARRFAAGSGDWR